MFLNIKSLIVSFILFILISEIPPGDRESQKIFRSPAATVKQQLQPFDSYPKNSPVTKTSQDSPVSHDFSIKCRAFRTCVDKC